MGLTHTLKTFKRTIKKRIDEEVFEVYRHGIVHGSVTRFDNAVVATKAWNILFAVSDWARATRKSTQPKKERPSWRDTWSTTQRFAAYKQYEERFEPTSITPASADFAGSEGCRRPVSSSWLGSMVGGATLPVRAADVCRSWI